MAPQDRMQISGATAPLDPATLAGLSRGPRPEAEVRAELEGLLAQARPMLAKLEERAELLWRACQEVGIAVPGLADWELRHGLSAKGEQILAYLRDVLKTDRNLIQPVQMTIFRFDQTRTAVEAGQAALGGATVAFALVEDLKRKLYYLARCANDFQHDPLLSQLFPVPKEAGASPGRAGTRPLSEVELLKHQMARDQLLLKGETLLAALKPALVLLRQVAATLAGKAFSMAELLTPDGRKARLVSLRLTGSEESQARLHGAIQGAERLGAAIAEVQSGRSGDVTPVRQAIVAMSHLALGVMRDPLLADLLAVDQAVLFLDEAALG